jgi:hypothetical protein
MTTLSTSLPTAQSRSPIRSVGYWLSVVLIGYLFFNVFRALTAPADFAATFGTPLSDNGDTSFVIVYAIRTLFISLYGLILLLRRDMPQLSTYLLVAAVMPIGDALLVATSGGASSIILRHVIIVGVVLVNWFLLRRWLTPHTGAHSSQR